MNLSFDTVVAGAGLAGACASFVLSSRESILVLDKCEPGSGASSVPLGLFSPLMARRARPTWRMPEAVEAFHRLVAEADAGDCFSAGGVLKPARSEGQAEEFKDASEKWPDHGRWYPPEQASEKWPHVYSEYGILDVLAGGRARIPQLCNRLVRSAESRGAATHFNDALVGWTEESTGLRIHLSSGRTFHAKRLLLTLGPGFKEFDQLRQLRLHPIKGQWIRLEMPAGLSAGLTVSSRTYVATEASSAVIGSSYEHDFEDLEPTPEIIAELREEAALLVPELVKCELVDAGAGVRVTVPEIRLPMIGKVPHNDRVWIFTGLGAKGLLMAPFLAYELPEFFAEPSTIPREISVNLR